MPRSEWEAACHHTGVCGLTGSAAFFASIPDSAVMINGPLWCYFYAMKYVYDQDATVSGRFFCTQPDQNSLVYGTEKDLLAAFEQVKNNDAVKRLFIENNCSVGMVGDDLKGIAGKADLPWPVYAIDSGGLQGSFEGGFAKAFLLATEEMKHCEVRERAVNVFGLSDSTLKGAEDREELKRLLSLCGYIVLATPGSGCDWETIRKAPSASYNIVVRDELGLAAAKRMEEKFGTPYISVGLPYGLKGTLRWAERIAESVPGGNAAAVRSEAKEWERDMRHRAGALQSLWGPIWFDRILAAGAPSETAGIVEAFRQEWGDTEEVTIHFTCETDICPDAANKVRIVGKDDRLIKSDYETWEDGLLLGSSHEASRLLRLGKSFARVHIARPCYDEWFLHDLPFCGLRGAPYLFERIGNEYVRRKTETKNKPSHMGRL